ncbi:ATP-binding protein [Azospirillum sp. SYSU D00513]|uniref:ATP-binding protein n=1 Tax=Azospirillum sp. SYSU D00513 TaxID=2812561 RepID=UPI001A97B83A|nr:ATP-binding protein [Azospirillum sp. SYSU D00513]
MTSKEVLQSCYERLCNLESTGIFKPTAPQFDPSSSIWRYDLSALSTDEQKMVVDMVAEDLFEDSRRTGEKGQTELFICIDEGHKFVTKDKDHVLSKIAREARKFGLGMILSSQGLGDFTDEILSNMGTKFILGVDSTFLDSTAKKLKIEPKRLSSIQIHKTAVIQIKNQMEDHGWHDMDLAG